MSCLKPVYSDTTQLNSTDPVEQRTASQSCFCLWRHNLQTESTGSLLLFTLWTCRQLDVELSSAEFSWVELCRYKHPLTLRTADVSHYIFFHSQTFCLDIGSIMTYILVVIWLDIISITSAPYLSQRVLQFCYFPRWIAFGPAFSTHYTLVPRFPVLRFAPLHFWRCRVFRCRIFSRPPPRVAAVASFVYCYGYETSAAVTLNIEPGWTAGCNLDIVITTARQLNLFISRNSSRTPVRIWPQPQQQQSLRGCPNSGHCRCRRRLDTGLSWQSTVDVIYVGLLSAIRELNARRRRFSRSQNRN